MASMPAITLNCPACGDPLLLPVTAELVPRGPGLPDLNMHIDDEAFKQHRLTHHPSEDTNADAHHRPDRPLPPQRR